MTSRIRLAILAAILGAVSAGPALSATAASVHTHARKSSIKSAVKKTKHKKKHKKVQKGGSSNAAKPAPTPTATATKTTIPTSGTIQLSGTMSTDNTLTMSGALSIGNATNVDWDIPLMQSVSVSGYSSQLDTPTFQWSVPPDSFTDLPAGNGNVVRRFHWNAPPANTVITVIETLHAVVKTDLTPFQSAAPFPMASLPDAVKYYLQQTPNTSLPPAAAQVVSSLAQGATTEEQVVTSVADYVASHTVYNRAVVKNDAADVWNSRLAVCPGYVNLMTGMLRQLNIPVRVEFGWVSALPISFPMNAGGIARHILAWSIPNTSGERHNWLEVYFPDQGWVPFDAQAEKFFVDPRHIAFYSNIDAGPLVDPNGKPWFGNAVGFSDANNDPVFGPTFADGRPVFTPGDGVESQVTLNQKADDQLTFVKFNDDVNNIFMYSR